MATLVDRPGFGKHVLGEAYRVTAQGLKELDALEGYHGRGSPENVYLRKKISIVVNNEVKTAFVYVIANPEEYEDSLDNDKAEIIAEYMLDMAKGPLKPGWPAEAALD